MDCATYNPELVEEFIRLLNEPDTKFHAFRETVVAVLAERIEARRNVLQTSTSETSLPATETQ